MTQGTGDICTSRWKLVEFLGDSADAFFFLVRAGVTKEGKVVRSSSGGGAAVVDGLRILSCREEFVLAST